MIKAKLLKPLDGKAIGETMELSDADFSRLRELGAVQRAPVAKAEPAFANKAEPAPTNKAAAKPAARK